MQVDSEGETRPSEPTPTAARTTVFTTAYGAVLRPIHAVGWRRIRITAYVTYFAVLVGVVIATGVPTGRLSLALIIVIGLLLSRIGRGWRAAGQVILDWLPFSLVLMAYDQTRGITDTLGIAVHERDILDAEKWLFGGTEPTLWLQQHLYNPAHVYWYDALCTLVYTSHFLASPILAAVLWLRNRTEWLRFISRLVVLSVAGLVTYCVFPEAPPWLAARDGLTEPVARLSARGWIFLHANNLNHVLANAQHDGPNPVAAMPSMHTAIATLVAIVAITRLRSRWRWLAVLYPVAMGYTLVYTGEHYVLDLIAGVVYALAVHLLMNRVERWWRDRRPVGPEPATHPADERPADDRPALTTENSPAPRG